MAAGRGSAHAPDVNALVYPPRNNEIPPRITGRPSSAVSCNSARSSRMRCATPSQHGEAMAGIPNRWPTRPPFGPDATALLATLRPQSARVSRPSVPSPSVTAKELGQHLVAARASTPGQTPATPREADAAPANGCPQLDGSATLLIAPPSQPEELSHHRPAAPASTVEQIPATPSATEVALPNGSPQIDLSATLLLTAQSSPPKVPATPRRAASAGRAGRGARQRHRAHTGHIATDEYLPRADPSRRRAAGLPSYEAQTISVPASARQSQPTRVPYTFQDNVVSEVEAKHYVTGPGTADVSASPAAQPTSHDSASARPTSSRRAVPPASPLTGYHSAERSLLLAALDDLRRENRRLRKDRAAALPHGQDWAPSLGAHHVKSMLAGVASASRSRRPMSARAATGEQYLATSAATEARRVTSAPTHTR